MLLIDNFVHADLHPGNIMVRFYQSEMPSLLFSREPTKSNQNRTENQKDVTEEVLARLRPCRHKKKDWEDQLVQIDREGYRPQLIFIDTGLVTELNATNRQNFLDLFKAIAEFDGYKAGHLMVQRCRQPDAVIDEEIFALKMQHLILGVKSRTFALGNIKIGDILNEVLSMVRRHHVRMEGDFINVVISILLLEGIGRSLDPSLDLFKRLVMISSLFLNQHNSPICSALPILRQLGAQGGSSLLKTGDFSILKVWAGLEARKFLQASAEEVSNDINLPDIC
jgi:aarF domain-containing kinase